MAAIILSLVSLKSSSYGGLYVDANCDLFGTTAQGVDSNGNVVYGTVFELPFAGIQQEINPDGSYVSYGAYETPITLATFDGTNGLGLNPSAGLVADASEDLFGATAQGGTSGEGTVFEIPWTGTGYGTPTTLVEFNNSSFPSTGSNPEAGLFLDSSGDLIGTTSTGGARRIWYDFRTRAERDRLFTQYSFLGNPFAGENSFVDGANPHQLGRRCQWRLVWDNVLGSTLVTHREQYSDCVTRTPADDRLVATTYMAGDPTNEFSLKVEAACDVIELRSPVSPIPSIEDLPPNPVEPHSSSSSSEARL
jgi:hypothetical protein